MSPHPFRRFAYAAAGIPLITIIAQAGDWPQWLGAGRDGKVTEFKAPETWPEELVKKWSVSVGDGVATPARVGDRLYVFARQDGAEVTRCLKAETGEELWEDRYDALGADGPARGFSGPRCSPAVAEGKVVTLGVRGILSCLDANTGQVLWRKDDFKGSWPSFYTSSSPVIAEGLCIAQLGGREDGAIVAYTLENGEEKWRWTGDGTAYASPVLVESGGQSLLVAVTDSKVVAVNLSDGKQAWETPFRVEGRGYNSATPVFDGSKVFFGGSNRGITAVQLDKEGDSYTGKQLWKNEEQNIGFSTPVLKDGHLYGLTGDNNIFCVNASDGKTRWTAALGGGEAAPPAARPERAEPDRAQGQGNEGRRGGRGGRGGGGGGRGGYGSLVDAGDVIFLLTPAAELIAFKPDPEAYTELARIKVAESGTHAFPVVTEAGIFIKDQDAVTLWTLP